MSTGAIDAVDLAIAKQLDALKIVDAKDVKTADADDAKTDDARTDDVKTDEVSTNVSPKKTRKYRNDDERRREWEEIQKTKEVKETGVKGVVRWYSILGHYGFITRDDGKGDVFVHQSAISKSKTEKYYLRTLADDERVEFNVVKGAKGLEAADVTGPEGSDVEGSRRFRILLRRTYHNGSPRSSATRSTRKPNPNKDSEEDVADKDSEEKPRRSRRRTNKGKHAHKRTAGNPSDAEQTSDADAALGGDAGDAGLGADAVIVTAQH